MHDMCINTRRAQNAHAHAQRVEDMCESCRLKPEHERVHMKKIAALFLHSRMEEIRQGSHNDVRWIFGVLVYHCIREKHIHIYMIIYTHIRTYVCVAYIRGER